MKEVKKNSKNIIDLLRSMSDNKKVFISASFFKTGKGEYGEGDIFLGISVPRIREFVKKLDDLELIDIKKILYSKYHEARLLALLILVNKYKRADKKKKKELTIFYMNNRQKINNWDLVDSSAHKILGDFYFNKKENPFKKLAKSKSLWDRRIAIISSFYNIRKDSYKLTIDLCEILLKDNDDLIHKACGWMLREVGKRSKKELVLFLKKNYREMPRTMLRYSLERLDKKEKYNFMNNLI